MEFYKNRLIDKILDNYYKTYSKTLDTADFVPGNHNDKIRNLIFKNMKRKFKEVGSWYLLILEEKGLKLKLFQRLKVFFSGLRPIYNIVMQEDKGKAELKETRKVKREQQKKKSKKNNPKI